MAIQVVCPGCKARFSVSDQFAGRSGPCPKCKKPITIPAPIQSVQIHEPEAPITSSKGTGKVPTAPLRRIDKPIATMVVTLTVIGTVATLLFALLARLACGPGGAPTWLLAVAAMVTALPCVRIGYTILREKELEPYSGQSLLVRSLVCAAVYAILWGVRSLLPAETTAEMWQWLYIAPLFFAAGGLAALATLELSWGNGIAHCSLYVLFTTLLRWLAGFPAF